MAYGYTYANPLIAAQQARDPRLAYAQGLMQQGASTAPVQSWGEGLARALQAGIGGVQARSVNKGYQAQDEGYRSALSKALGSQDPLAAMSASGDPTLMGDAMQAKLAQALKGPEADPLVKVYDPAQKAEVWLPQSKAAGLAAEGPAEPKAPTMRQVHRNGLVVDQQFDPTNPQAVGGWVDVGSGPQFHDAPRAPAGLITLIGPDNKPVSLREDDPQINDMLTKGYTVRQGSGVTINNQTEDQAKASQLSSRTEQQLPIVLDNFDALSNPKDQLAGMLPNSVSNMVTSEKYQRASNALTDIAASYLYSVSGATANPGEVANLVKTVTPVIGESDASKADKKARIKQMVESIKLRMKPGTEPQGGTVLNFDAQGKLIP